MLDTRDSFAVFLQQELALVSVAANYMLQSSDTPDAQRLKEDAVNIHFLGDFSADKIDKVITSIDIIHRDERTAIAWQLKVLKILRVGGMLQKKSYDANPDSPTVPSQAGWIFWDMRDLDFQLIPSSSYVHLNLTMDLSHYIPLS